MLNERHLNLSLVRLKSSEEWVNHEEGLCFVFSKGGTGRYVSKTATQRLAAGDVLVFNGVSGGTLSAGDKGDFLFRSFSIVFEHLLPLFASNEVSLLHGVIEKFKVAQIYPGGSALAQECQRQLEIVNPQPDLEHRSQLLRTASAILSVEFKNLQGLRGGFGRADDHMSQVFERLSSSELLNLSVGELASKFSCSRRHLNRLFHERFGISVAALRMEMRLLKAISLLRDPNIKIIHVAEQCGFNHLGLFNTCFKRRYGNSPGQWRKTNLKDQKSPASSRIGGMQGCPLSASGICSWSGRMDAASQSSSARNSNAARMSG